MVLLLLPLVGAERLLVARRQVVVQVVVSMVSVMRVVVVVAGDRGLVHGERRTHGWPVVGRVRGERRVCARLQLVGCERMRKGCCCCCCCWLCKTLGGDSLLLLVAQLGRATCDAIRVR